MTTLYRLHDAIREPVNTYTHLLGAVMALVGWFVLHVMVGWQDGLLVLAVGIYGITSLLTFLASTTLHAYSGKSKRMMQWLIRLDHSAIYLMIAGTYTPFAYALLRNPTQITTLLVMVWVMAVIGITYKLTSWRGDTRLSTAYYVVMGWLVVPYIPSALPMISDLALILLLIGGAVYTLGAVIFALERPNLSETWGFHELWHICVLIGFALHWVAVLLVVS
jgi:hemolysin III